MDVKMNYQGIDYTFYGVFFDPGSPGGRDEPTYASSVDDYEEVMAHLESGKDIIVTEIFNSLTDESEVCEALLEVIEEEAQERYEDYLENRYSEGY